MKMEYKGGSHFRRNASSHVGCTFIPSFALLFLFHEDALSSPFFQEFSRFYRVYVIVPIQRSCLIRIGRCPEWLRFVGDPVLL